MEPAYRSYGEMSADMVNFYDELTRLLEQLKLSERRGDAMVLKKRLDVEIDKIITQMDYGHDKDLRWVFRRIECLDDLQLLPSHFYTDEVNPALFAFMAEFKARLCTVAAPFRQVPGPMYA